MKIDVITGAVSSRVSVGEQRRKNAESKDERTVRRPRLHVAWFSAAQNDNHARDDIAMTTAALVSVRGQWSLT